jgi:hypothetical protein
MELSWAQYHWNNVLDAFGYDAFNVQVYGSFLVSMAIYWGMGGLFTIVDYAGKPKFMLKYRVQENVKTYPVKQKINPPFSTVSLLNNTETYDDIFFFTLDF